MGLLSLDQKSFDPRVKSAGNCDLSVSPAVCGQAVVEYILILVVVVGIIVALMKIFFAPGREFLQTTMGNYIECLLDYGDLPFLGVDGKSAAEECKGQLKTGSANFSTAMGSARSGTSLSSTADGKGLSGPGGGSGSGAGGSAAAEARAAAARRNARNRRGGGATDGLAANSKVSISSPDPLADTKFMNTNTTAYESYGRRSRSVIVSELVESERKKIKQRSEKVFSIRLPEGAEISKPNRKLVLQNSERKIAQDNQEEPTWSLGKVFRIAIIVSIIVILLIVLGSQVLQVSKGME